MTQKLREGFHRKDLVCPVHTHTRTDPNLLMLLVHDCQFKTAAAVLLLQTQSYQATTEKQYIHFILENK